MKQTITEIFVEIEETILVRQTEKKAADENASPGKYIQICPHCGEAIDQTELLKSGAEEE
jgi:hypothetical protein